MDTMKEKTALSNLLTELMGKDYVKADATIFQNMSDLQSDIAKDFYTVVVLGEFKRGKSTFVNALLGTRLLPMDVLPETATINAIMYSETPKLSVLYRDGNEVKGAVTYDYMKQFSANDGNSALKNISYIKIGYPCELLKNRIVLVDTPGVSDLNEQRAEITYRFVPKANAVLFLLDANSPLKRTEKDFIEEKLLPLGISNILFLLNKYDQVDEESDADFLERTRKRILNAFKGTSREVSRLCIKILPISAKQALQGIEQNNPTLLKESGLKAVLDELQTMIFHGSIEQEKIKGYKTRLMIVVNLLKQALVSEKIMKSADVEELQKATVALNQILNTNDAVEKELSSYVETAKRQMYAMSDKSIQYFHDKLREAILDMIAQYRSQDFKSFIETTVSKQIRKNIEIWVGNYAPRIDELLATMERELSKGLSRYFNQQISLQAAKGAQLQNIVSVMNVDARDISNTGFQANAITAVGAVVAAALVTPLLLPIIGFVGREQIHNKLLSGRLTEAKAEVAPQIENHIAKITAELSNHVHEYIDQRSELIKQTAFKAYNLILTDMRQRIQNQLDEKRIKRKDLELELHKLEGQLAEVTGIIFQLEEDAQ